MNGPRLQEMLQTRGRPCSDRLGSVPSWWGQTTLQEAMSGDTRTTLGVRISLTSLEGTHTPGRCHLTHSSGKMETFCCWLKLLVASPGIQRSRVDEATLRHHSHQVLWQHADTTRRALTLWAWWEACPPPTSTEHPVFPWTAVPYRIQALLGLQQHENLFGSRMRRTEQPQAAEVPRSPQGLVFENISKDENGQEVYYGLPLKYTPMWVLVKLSSMIYLITRRHFNGPLTWVVLRWDHEARLWGISPCFVPLWIFLPKRHTAAFPILKCSLNWIMIWLFFLKWHHTHTHTHIPAHYQPSILYIFQCTLTTVSDALRVLIVWLFLLKLWKANVHAFWLRILFPGHIALPGIEQIINF